MNIRKTLIVGLMATSVAGWLQAETLTFNFTTSSVSFGSSSAVSNVGTAFSGVLNVQSVTSPGASASCNSCTLNFTTGTLGGFSDTSIFDVGSAFFYSFNSGGNYSAATGPSGSLNNANPPGTSGGVGASSTLVSGTIGAGTLGGVQFDSGPSSTMLSFNAPVTATLSGNMLSTILAGFGLGSILNGGTLAFNITLPGAPNSNGYFAGSVSGGTLTLNVVPEPSSILLIGLGLIGVAFIGRKRLLTHRL